jgi:hypothetical protein
METLVWTRGRAFPLSRLRAGCDVPSADRAMSSCSFNRRRMLPLRSASSLAPHGPGRYIDQAVGDDRGAVPNRCHEETVEVPNLLKSLG